MSYGCRVAADGFDKAARTMSDAGARFVTVLLAGSPERALMAVFALRGDLVVLRAPLGADEARSAAVAGRVAARRALG